MAVWSSYNGGMQINTRSILHAPVYNIELGGQIGNIASVIVEPSTLKVQFFEIGEPKRHQRLYLLSSDIRSISRNHLVINAETNLAAADELVRYTELLKNPLTLFGYKVVTNSRKKLGNCYDFVFDTTTMEITKIYVKAGLMQRLFISHHIIDVTDITEIKPGLIVVRDAIIAELRKARNILPVETT